MKRLRNRVGTILKRYYIFQRVYAWAELLLGEVELRRHRRFRALEHFCKALRRVDRDTVVRRKANKHFRLSLGRNQTDHDSLEVHQDFLRTEYAAVLRARFQRQPFPLSVTFRGHLLPLKSYNPQTGEKGVLALSFNEHFQAFHALFRTPELSRFYWIVLEPSVYYFEDPAYALFRDWNVVLQAGKSVLREGLQQMESFFDSVPLTNSDWTDFDVFRPLNDQPKLYDLIYVANWSRNKQHELLLRTVASIQRPLRVALVGFHLERGREEIDRLVKRYGLASRCDVFERLSPDRVNQLLNRSRVNLLLSRFEASNKALSEAMFANLPSVVYRGCKGQDLTSINKQTGLLADDAELGEAIMMALDRLDRFSPREWALEHTGYLRSTKVLNDTLRELSEIRNEPWTTDIAAKVNRPDFLYKNREDAKRLEPILHHLLAHTRS